MISQKEAEQEEKEKQLEEMDKEKQLEIEHKQRETNGYKFWDGEGGVT